jgi:hypothetical protein
MAEKSVRPICCGNCWYFEPMEDGMVQGECFRYPPIAQFADSYVIAEAPPVDSDRRPCGEYREIKGSH